MGFAELGFSLLLLAAVVGGFAWLMSHAHKLFRPKNSKGSAALGNALQELDRLVARPSVEHKIETEQRIQVRDEQGSD